MGGREGGGGGEGRGLAVLNKGPGGGGIIDHIMTSQYCAFHTALTALYLIVVLIILYQVNFPLEKIKFSSLTLIG